MAQADGWHDAGYASGHEAVREIVRDLRSSLQSNLRSDMQTGMQTDMQTDMQAGIQTANPRGLPPGLLSSGAAGQGSGSPASSLSALVHDTRNLVASIVLYCDLLDEPGVLSRPFLHYSGELRKVAYASQRLLDRISALSTRGATSSPAVSAPLASRSMARKTSAAKLSERPETPAREADCREEEDRKAEDQKADAQMVESLAGELMANQNLLAALAGPGVAVDVCLLGGSVPVAMTADDLNRILINLTRNSVEAMQGRGRIEIKLEELPAWFEAAPGVPASGDDPQTSSPPVVSRLRLTFSDNGPGIPQSALESVFAPGFTTHLPSQACFAEGGEPCGTGDEHVFSEIALAGPDAVADPDTLADLDALPDDYGALQPPRRGLGLAIVRSLVHAAGGTVRAVHRVSPAGHGQERSLPDARIPQPTGASFVLEFPVRRRPPSAHCAVAHAPSQTAVDAASNGPPPIL